MDEEFDFDLNLSLDQLTFEEQVNDEVLDMPKKSTNKATPSLDRLPKRRRIQSPTRQYTPKKTKSLTNIFSENRKSLSPTRRPFIERMVTHSNDMEQQQGNSPYRNDMLRQSLDILSPVHSPKRIVEYSYGQTNLSGIRRLSDASSPPQLAKKRDSIEQGSLMMLSSEPVTNTSQKKRHSSPTKTIIHSMEQMTPEPRRASSPHSNLDDTSQQRILLLRSFDKQNQSIKFVDWNKPYQAKHLLQKLKDPVNVESIKEKTTVPEKVLGTIDASLINRLKSSTTNQQPSSSPKSYTSKKKVASQLLQRLANQTFRHKVANIETELQLYHDRHQLHDNAEAKAFVRHQWIQSQVDKVRAELTKVEIEQEIVYPSPPPLKGSEDMNTAFKHHLKAKTDWIDAIPRKTSLRHLYRDHLSDMRMIRREFRDAIGQIKDPSHPLFT
mmetsp:Transcript_4294/g.6310  ORF Transcript_4294/g.6310 Transcript_4294/m.6310 type:complete len:439 (+) Transcript_4294:17-1333(+)